MGFSRVTITAPKFLVDKAIKLSEEDEGFNGDIESFKNHIGLDEDYAEDIETDKKLHLYTFASEAKWSNWDELEGFLSEHKIGYNKTWGESVDFAAGESFHRYDTKNNTMSSFEIDDTQEPFIKFLKENINKTPKEIKKSLEDQLSKFFPFEPCPLEDIAPQVKNKKNFVNNCN